MHTLADSHEHIAKVRGSVPGQRVLLYPFEFQNVREVFLIASMPATLLPVNSGMKELGAAVADALAGSAEGVPTPLDTVIEHCLRRCSPSRRSGRGARFSDERRSAISGNRQGLSWWSQRVMGEYQAMIRGTTP